MNEVDVISTLLFFALFFILITSWRHKYLIDSYREKLFNLRFNLFEYGYKKQIFDTEEYRAIENEINENINQLHKTNPVVFIPLLIVQYRFEKKYNSPLFENSNEIKLTDEELIQYYLKLKMFIVHFFFAYSLTFNFICTLLKFISLIRPNRHKPKNDNDKIEQAILFSVKGLKPSFNF